MRNKKTLLFIASVTAGCFLFLSGCGVDLTNIAVEETTLSAEMESEDLTDGTCQIHGIFYNTDNSLLAGASVTVLENGSELFSGITDDSGTLEGFSIPANTPVDLVIADASGNEQAKSTIVCKLSSAYDDITIYPVHGEEDKELVLEVPVKKTNMRAALFITDTGKITIANVSPYIASSTETPTEGDADASADAAQTEGDAAQAQGDAAQDQSDAAQPQGDAAQPQGDAAQPQGDAAQAQGDAAQPQSDAQ